MACEFLTTFFRESCTTRAVRPFAGWSAVITGSLSALSYIALLGMKYIGDDDSINDAPSGNLYVNAATDLGMSAAIFSIIWMGTVTCQRFQQNSANNIDGNGDKKRTLLDHDQMLRPDDRDSKNAQDSYSTTFFGSGEFAGYAFALQGTTNTLNQERYYLQAYLSGDLKDTAVGELSIFAGNSFTPEEIMNFEIKDHEDLCRELTGQIRSISYDF